MWNLKRSVWPSTKWTPTGSWISKPGLFPFSQKFLMKEERLNGGIIETRWISVTKRHLERAMSRFD